MSNLPMGYNHPVMPEDIEIEAIEHCVKYIIENDVKFRRDGEKNTMAWWDNKGNQGKELISFVMLLRGIVTSVDDSESEHICACGSRGWKANCDQCIPY